MSWRVWLLMLATLAVFAAAWRRCSHRMLVGDFPIVERSSRGLVLVTLPHVAALVAPSARVRTRAMREKHRGLSRALRQSRGWAWCPAPRCPLRYGSTPQLSRGPTQTTLAQSALLGRERQPPKRATLPSLPTNQTIPPRAQTPKNQVKAQVQARFSRRYRAEPHDSGCARYETRCWRSSPPQLLRDVQNSAWLLALPVSADERHQKTRDCDDHEPRQRATTSVKPSLVAF